MGFQVFSLWIVRNQNACVTVSVCSGKESGHFVFPVRYVIADLCPFGAGYWCITQGLYSRVMFRFLAAITASQFSLPASGQASRERTIVLLIGVSTTDTSVSHGYTSTAYHGRPMRSAKRCAWQRPDTLHWPKWSRGLAVINDRCYCIVDERRALLAQVCFTGIVHLYH